MLIQIMQLTQNCSKRRLHQTFHYHQGKGEILLLLKSPSDFQKTNEKLKKVLFRTLNLETLRLLSKNSFFVKNFSPFKVQFKSMEEPRLHLHAIKVLRMVWHSKHFAALTKREKCKWKFRDPKKKLKCSTNANDP